MFEVVVRILLACTDPSLQRQVTAIARAIGAGREIADDNVVDARIVNRLRELQEPGETPGVRSRSISSCVRWRR